MKVYLWGPLVIGACVSCPERKTASLPETMDGATVPPPARAIRRVDFMNHEYPGYCFGDDAVRTVDGIYSWQDDEDDLTIELEVLGVEYGDLDGDGVEEAVVLTNCSGGGTGQFTRAWVYRWSGDRALVMGVVKGGDRADGGLASARVQDGVVVVERYRGDESSGACCPVFVDTERWGWNGREFVVVAPPERRPYVEEPYPASRP